MLIEVQVPSLLRDCTDGRVSFQLEAHTLQEALDNLLETFPLLRIHIYTEAGQVRKHVLLFYNDQNLAWIDNFEIPLQAGDRLIVFQAVSGG